MWMILILILGIYIYNRLSNDVKRDLSIMWHQGTSIYVAYAKLPQTGTTKPYRLCNYSDSFILQQGVQLLAECNLFRQQLGFLGVPMAYVCIGTGSVNIEFSGITPSIQGSAGMRFYQISSVWNPKDQIYDVFSELKMC